MQTFLNVVFWPARAVYLHWARRQAQINSARREAEYRTFKKKEQQEQEYNIKRAMSDFDMWWRSGGKVK